MNSFFSSRKAFNGDVAVLMVFVFIVGLVAVAGGEIFDRVSDGFAGSNISPDAQSSFSVLNERYVSVWDGAFIMLFSLFGIALLLSTASLGSRPEFFFVTVIVGLFFVGFAAVISNVFSDAFSYFSSSGSWTYIPLLLNNLVEAVLLLLALLVFGLFVKIKGVNL